MNIALPAGLELESSIAKSVGPSSLAEVAGPPSPDDPRVFLMPAKVDVSPVVRFVSRIRWYK
jgi:hypothetical protein